jgi:MFS superfamily sulfate permease-like transporter
LVCLSGALLALLGLAGQGQIAAFVSRPVLRGFAFALAATIVIKQLPDALGLSLPASITHDPIHLLTAVVQRAAQWHGPSMGVALAASGVMLLLKPWRAIPAAMVTIVLAISVGVMLDLPAWGVREVGDITPPQWHWSVPDLSQSQWMRMGELTFGLVLIVFAESWGSMRSLALAHGDSLNPNRELVALGACNLAVGLMQGMPVGAGFSASTANASAGAKSRWAGVVTLAVIALAVVFALPAVHLLPRPVLAVVVIHALLHALDPRPLFQAWRLNRDRIAMLGAVLAVLMLGVLHGMLVGVGLSLLMALHRFSVPSLHALGELPGTRDFIVAQGRSDLTLHDNIVILRPEEPLFFANIDKVCQAIVQWPQLAHPAKVVVLSLEESSDLDSTAFEALMELDQRLAQQGQTLVLSRVKESVRLLFEQHAGERWQGSQRLFWSVSDAVDAYRLPATP